MAQLLQIGLQVTLAVLVRVTLVTAAVNCSAPSLVVNATYTPVNTSYNVNDTVTFTCNTGYTVASGDLQHVCNETGLWNGTTPVCSIVTCSPPSTVNFSSVVPVSGPYDYNTTIVYTCDATYNHTQGDLERRCNESAIWTGAPPVCSLVTCIAPDAVNHSTVTPSPGPYDYNTTIVYTCSTGSNYTGGDLERRCNESGLWTNNPPICTLLTCTAPDAVNYTSVTPVLDPYDYNTTIVYTCNTGYNHTGGDLERRCNESSIWTADPPVCTPVTCSPPLTVNFTSLTPVLDPYDYNTTIAYTCDTGYNRTDGDLERRCNETAKWSGEPPVCTLVTCSSPAVVNFASLTPVLDPYDYNSTIVYTCNTGYNHTSGVLERRCNETALWTGDPPVCTLITCSPPTLVNDASLTPVADPYDYNTTIVYTCNMGYNHTGGDLERRCNKSAMWTGGKPVCTLITCSPPTIVNDSSLTPVLDPYDYNSTIVYTCNTGYNHTAGGLERRCNETAMWTGDAPVCALVTCSPPTIVNNTSLNPVLDPYDYNTTILYTCSTGYNYTGGDLERRCDATGSWTNDPPICTLVTCVPPNPVTFSSLTPVLDPYDYNTTIVYTCDMGYNRTEGDRERRCNETANWTGDPPVCTLVTCSPPAIVDHSSMTPVLDPYDYNSTIVYTCNLGYNHTAGALERRCSETAMWTGDAPVCTLVTCNPPDSVPKGSYLPVTASYDYNSTVEYTCELGYNATSGDVTRRCTETSMWTGVAPNCTLVTCPKEDVQYMTYSPVTAGTTFDYNVTVTYECILGYNYSLGDVSRKCDHNGQWTGVTPECVIVTCDPPAAIPFATYTPHQAEHDYDTAVTFSCDQDHHYVTGDTTMKCHYTGTWPALGFDCSVKHFIELQPGEPSVIVMDDDVTFADVSFTYDGLCTVTADVSPDRLNFSVEQTSATTFSMNISTTTSTVPDVYDVVLSPTRHSRTFPDFHAAVFWGYSVSGIQGRLVKTTHYIKVGEPVTFQLTLTQGTNVTVEWQLEDDVNVTDVFPGYFSMATTAHTFNATGDNNVTIVARNYISSLETVVYVRVIYEVNRVSFSVAETLGNTTHPLQFNVSLAADIKLPVEYLNITIDYGQGDSNFSKQYPDAAPSMPVSYVFDHIFPTQGQYTVNARVENFINYINLEVVVNIWDSLEPLDLVVKYDDDGKYITDTTTILAFVNVPNAGFEYTINWGDGSPLDTNTDSSILYSLYSLGNFTHVYTSAGLYTVTWEATNPFYRTTRSFQILVQNTLPWNETQYVIEPILNKYPWLNLQSMNVSLNITLNSNFPLATDANCTFDPDDGSTTEDNLPFERFFEVQHLFGTVGTFNSSTSCQNEVSSYVFQYSNVVMKFLASFVSVIYVEIVPLNVSNTVIVYFHIDNDGFALLPEQVFLTFDFDDGSAIQQVTYNETFYTHTYSERGNYSLTVGVRADVLSTTSQLTLPLRLGYMHFEYSGLIGFIDTTVITYYLWGILGPATTYTLNFGDGTSDGSCLATDKWGCTVTHVFPNHGYKTVVATGRNDSFVEIDSLVMTIDNPIKGLIKEIPDTVSIPDGSVTVKLHIADDDPYLPDLNCDFNFADAILREIKHDQQTVNVGDPFVYDFTYISLGRRVIDIYCWNLINSTNITHEITVTNVDFLYTGSFDRQYSQVNSPLLLSAMKDNELFCRLAVLADFDAKTPRYLWSLDPSNQRSTFLIPRGYLSDGEYPVSLNVSFAEEPENVIYEPTFIELISPPPESVIRGGQRRYSRRGSIALDATLSYDPVFPTATLQYTWSCSGYSGFASFDDLATKHSSSTGQQSCVSTAVNGSQTVLTATAAPQSDGYAVTVAVATSAGMNASFTQFIVIQETSDLAIVCHINCLAKVAISSKLQLLSDLTVVGTETWSWSLTRKQGGTYSETISLSTIIETAVTSPSFVLKADTLATDSQYLVSLSVTKNNTVHGPAFYEFTTNTRPEGGNCSIFPYENSSQILGTTAATVEGLAAVTEFNLTCVGWKDEGYGDVMTTHQPLYYLFFLQYGDTSYHRQILYFDGGSTSPLVTFRLGDVSDQYKADVVIRVYDVFGDYTELSERVISNPNMTTADLNGLTSTEVLVAVKGYIDQFDDAIKKANRSHDYRTLATKIEAAASAYNILVVQTDESATSLSAEALTSLGSQVNADGSQVGWTEYWEMIVVTPDTSTQDYLIQKGRMYIEMILYQLNTWPAGRRIGLEALDLMSRSLNTTLSNKNFVDNVTALTAADCLKKLGAKLGEHMDQRTLPNTEHVTSIAKALVDAVANILTYLQTVLTPNLPDDPTVDQMRKYLQYIQVFQADDPASAELSLQEQTFLVQKQLQKIAVKKHWKSEASKVAVPLMETAMKSVVMVMAKMSEIGQQYLYIDNTMLHMSVEVNTARNYDNTHLSRPRVSVELANLQAASLSTIVTTEMVIYKTNPFFWGTFGDRITSYVPKFYLENAQLGQQIKFLLQNKEEAECIEQTPTYEDDDPDNTIYILFDRTYIDDDLLLFIKPESTALTYELFFQALEKPVIADGDYFFTTTINTAIRTDEDGLKVPISAEDIPVTGKVWIALRPILLNPADESRRNELLNAKFCASVTNGNCLIWRPDTQGEYFWDKESCRVAEESTRRETVCECTKPSSTAEFSIGTTFFVPFNKVDFATLPVTSMTYGNAAVLWTVVANYLAFALLVFWAWREDIKDQYKWAYALLVDNDIADDKFYLMKVYTGLRGGAGTRSKIGFIIVGEDSDTGIRILDDDSGVGCERGSVRTFVLATRRSLGELLCLRIWHDDSGGSQASWFLNKITVEDLQSKIRYFFLCSRWLAAEEDDGAVDRMLPVSGRNFRSVGEMASYTLVENHLWISTFLRPLKSNFSRLQRLSCLTALVFVSMFTSMLMMKSPDEWAGIDEVVIGALRFSVEAFATSIKSILVAMVPVSLVCFLFYYSKTPEETHQGFDRRIYARLNKCKRFDSTVVATLYKPPASVAVFDYQHFLPRASRVIGWSLLLACLTAFSYFLLVDSTDWLETTSERWMTMQLLSILSSILIIDVVKVLLMVALSAVFFNNGYEPPEPDVDLDELKELTRKNSRFYSIGPQYQEQLYYPPIPTAEELRRNKQKRLEQQYALSMLYQLAIYGFLLTIVYTISFASRDTRSFLLKNEMETVFGFDTVSDMDSYITWLETNFTNTYFAENFYGAPFANDSFKPYIKDLANVKVGPARLRQVRIKEEPCQGPLGVDETCYNKYKSSKEETGSYCLGWNPMPCPVSEKADSFSSPAWIYFSSSEVWGFPTMATYGTYGGGGYFMKLDVNKDVSQKIFDELVSSQWMDRQTRAVILEFTVYNANANLFSYVKFVAEFPEVGGVIPYTDIQTFRLFTHSGSDGNFILLCEFFFLIYVIIATIFIVYGICSKGVEYFKSLWNMMDIFALLASYVTVSLFIYKLFLIEKTIQVFHDDKNAYVGFENLAFYDFTVNTIHACLVFLLSIRVSRVLGFSSKINEMGSVISNCSEDLIGFAIIFGVAYFAYVAMGTLLFGKDTAKYRDMFQTYGTLTEAVIGKNRITNILTSNPGLAEFYYFTFVLFILLTLATMAAAILNFSISDVKDNSSDDFKPPNPIDLLAKRGKQLLGFLGLIDKSGKFHELDAKQRRSSELELNDILAELKTTVKDIIKRKNFKKKYRPRSASKKAIV